jgi:TPR repeat protein
MVACLILAPYRATLQPNAMYNPGISYAKGTGIEKNLTEAARWFQSAAKLGLTDSQFNLAVMCDHGLGVEVSLAEACKWYAIAETGGDMDPRHVPRHSRHKSQPRKRAPPIRSSRPSSRVAQKS